MRKSVYPRMVQDRRMLQTDADYRIAIMQDMLNDYTAAEAIEQSPQPLLPFNPPAPHA